MGPLGISVIREFDLFFPSSHSVSLHCTLLGRSKLPPPFPIQFFTWSEVFDFKGSNIDFVLYYLENQHVGVP